jgi:hypothetical protein
LLRRAVISTFYFILSTFLLASCANHHFRIPAEGAPTGSPHYVELLAEKQVATLHFPAGWYFFYAVDDTGTYYRSLRPIIQHTGGGSVRQNGGLYVTKRSPQKLRGYIFYAGKLTQIGDLTRVPHVFRD